MYAQTLSHHLKGAKRLEWPAVKAAMVEEQPLLEGPLPLLVVLVLGLTLALLVVLALIEFLGRRPAQPAVEAATGQP